MAALQTGDLGPLTDQLNELGATNQPAMWDAIDQLNDEAVSHGYMINVSGGMATIASIWGSPASAAEDEPGQISNAETDAAVFSALGQEGTAQGSPFADGLAALQNGDTGPLISQLNELGSTNQPAMWDAIDQLNEQAMEHGYMINTSGGTAIITQLWGSPAQTEGPAQVGAAQPTQSGEGEVATPAELQEAEDTGGSVTLPSIPGDVNSPPMTEKQAELAARARVDTTPYKSDSGKANANEVYQVDHGDGTRSAYKPGKGEVAKDGYGPMWRNEVGTHVVSEALGLGVVPTTVAVDGSEGVGSMQEWANGDRLDADQYSEKAQHQMAVLDYVTGNGDRHDGNIVGQSELGPDGEPLPAAIDNGQTFGDENAAAIRSDFVINNFNTPLHPDVIAGLQKLATPEAQNALKQQLLGLGISPEGVQGAMDRLNEVIANGRITGDKWYGAYVTGGDPPKMTYGKITPNSNWVELPSEKQ
jgi:hypothetical protein